MRELTKEQKRLLSSWYEENWKKLKKTGGVLFFRIEDCEHFSIELLQKLEALNDTEILIQNINRYISDKGCADTRSLLPWE